MRWAIPLLLIASAVWADKVTLTPFEDFEDVGKRVPMAHQVDKLIAKRVEEELSNPNEKYRLFVSR